MKKLKIILTFLFLSLITVSITSCAVRLRENHEDRGMHRGWFKNNHHRDRNVYIISDDNHRHSKATRNVKVNNQKKNQWDAKK